MNVLKTLQRVVSKNEALGVSTGSPQLISPKLFAKESTPKIRSKDDNDLTQNPDDNALNSQYRRLVNKDSSYQKNFIKDYLRAFNKTHDFKRLQVQNDYDVERAKSLYKLKKDISENTNFQETQDEIFMKKVLPFLTLPANKHSSNQILLPATPRVRKVFPKDDYNEVPSPPDFNIDSHSFENYIGLLTHTTFHFRNSSSSNGIIPLLLRTLLHPMNETTRPYHTTETYNDMILFFYHKNDLASMRETYSLIKMSNCQPNIQTVNIMLSGLLQNARNHSSPHEHRNITFYLDQMNKNSIVPDAVTWNILFNFLQSKKGRSYFVERLVANNIPVTTKLIISILRKSDEINDLSGTELLRIFQQNGVKMDYDMFKFFTNNVLEKNELDNALVTVQHIYRESIEREQVDVRVTTDILNMFICHFGNSGNLGLALQTFNTFTHDYRVRPNDTTFEMLFKCLVRNGYGKNFPVALQWIKNTRFKYTKSKRNNYWKVKCDSIARYNCIKKVTEDDITKLDTMLHNFKLPRDKKVTYDTWRNANSAERKVLRYINCRPGNKHTLGKSEPSIKNTDTTRSRKRHYRYGVARIAVGSAESKRIPYAKDWYGALNDELKQRGILESE